MSQPSTERKPHCRHLHRAVTAEECGRCWLRGEGDVTFYPVVAEEHGGMILSANGAGWDECRARHIEVTHGAD